MNRPYDKPDPNKKEDPKADAYCPTCKRWYCTRNEGSKHAGH